MKDTQVLYCREAVRHIHKHEETTETADKGLPQNIQDQNGRLVISPFSMTKASYVKVRATDTVFRLARSVDQLSRGWSLHYCEI
jgi:hypothetical protein